MLFSKQKSWEEISGFLENDHRIFILGCNGCAEASGTGGAKQVAELRDKLEDAGKAVTGTAVIDFLCEKALVKSVLRGQIGPIQAADSLLVMTCGVGVQAVAASVNKVCHPGCDTINLGGSRGEWMGSERCVECGECVLEYTGGICPRTTCAKGLVSGQCGGASKGKCEIDRIRDCGWEQIYLRLKSLNRLEILKHFVPPQDYSKMKPGGELMSTSRFALERPDLG